MPRTLTPAPTDRSMWRRLLRVVHPDYGGAEDLFVWTRNLQEYVASDTVEAPRPEYAPPRDARTTTDTSDRVDFREAFAKADDFDDLTRHALAWAEQVDEVYARLLRLLSDSGTEDDAIGQLAALYGFTV
jgi:hypothetical protein